MYGGIWLFATLYPDTYLLMRDDAEDICHDIG